MKKLLSIAAVAALLTTGAFAGANEIIISGDIEAGAQVSFGAAPTGTLIGGAFVFEEATLAFNTMTLGSSNDVTNAVHVNTNSQTGITMSITGTPLTSSETGSSATIPTSYTFDGSAVAADGTIFQLVTTTNDGTATTGAFVATAAPTASQESGAYATTLTVVIAAI
jgi:hypothetical protein